jgi:hypothetical protein
VNADLVDARTWTDGTHTDDPRGLPPGVTLSDPHGHARLVGVNGRALTVLDIGPVTVGGVEVVDPEHLEVLADRLRMLAGRLRGRPHLRSE